MLWLVAKVLLIQPEDIRDPASTSQGIMVCYDGTVRIRLAILFRSHTGNRAKACQGLPSPAKLHLHSCRPQEPHVRYHSGLFMPVQHHRYRLN